MLGDDFGTMCLNIKEIIESKVLGCSLTNREVKEQIRSLHKHHTHALIDYLNHGDKQSREFLELCNNHLQDISQERLDFLEPVLSKNDERDKRKSE